MIFSTFISNKFRIYFHSVRHFYKSSSTIRMKIYTQMKSFLMEKLFKSDPTLIECIKHLETVMSRHFVTVMKSTDEYVSGQRSNRRIVLLIVVKLMVLINLLRFGVSALINKVENLKKYIENVLIIFALPII